MVEYDHGLLGCNVMQFNRQVRKYLRDLLPPTSTLQKEAADLQFQYHKTVTADMF